MSEGAGLRRYWLRARQQQFAIAGPTTQTAPLTDPQSQTAAALHSFAKPLQMLVGTITDTAATAHCYRVQFEKLKSPMTGVFSTRLTSAASGVRDINTLQPGTRVLCAVSDLLPYTVIVSVLPPPGTAAKFATPDMISQASRQRADPAHFKPTQLHANGFVGDWLAGRPFDSTTAGEAGWIAETGVKVTIDSFMAQIAADEACGVFAFYHDQLLRIAAYNHQLWTAGHEREGLDDESEYNDIAGWTPYPWEQLGLFQRGDPVTEHPPQEWQVSAKHFAAWEPKETKAQAWHRTRLFQGYLGQGHKLLVQGEPAAPPDVFTYDPEDIKFPGLFDFNVGLDGRLFIQSAKGISIVKRAGIVSPIRKKRPEDPQGDNSENYKAASEVGGGPDHTITGDIEATAQDPHMQRAAGVLDMHAYIFNYAGVHPFFWHSKDWETPDESELDYLNGEPWKISPLNQLAGAYYLSEVTPLRLKIDHRYGTQDIFQTESGIDFLPDGGVVIYDGYGSEIRMTAGHISIDAAGDVWMRPGRNINLWAGWDAIIRAKNSIDISASTKDVRVKSQRNMQMLAGNGEEGGILLESRAPGSVFDFEKCGEKVRSSGVMIKTPHSEFVAWSKHVYLRTGGGDVEPGVITLDAHEGQQNVLMHAQTCIMHVHTAAQIFVESEGDVNCAFEFKPGQATFDANLCVDGVLTLAGSIYMEGSIYVAAGHIFTEQAQSYECESPGCYSVGWLKDPRPVYETVDKCREYASNELHLIGENNYQSQIYALWYISGRPGESQVIDDADMGFRTVEEYYTSDFRIYETRWQQIGRLSGTLTATWSERSVSCHGVDTYPYPGQSNFEQDKWFQQDLEIFEISGPTGHSVNRGGDGSLAGPYQSPKHASPAAENLNSYIVIR